MVSTYEEAVFRHGAAFGRHEPLSGLFSGVQPRCLKSFFSYGQMISSYVETSSPIKETISMVKEMSSPYVESASSYQETSATYRQMIPNSWFSRKWWNPKNIFIFAGFQKWLAKFLLSEIRSSGTQTLTNRHRGMVLICGGGRVLRCLGIHGALLRI